MTTIITPRPPLNLFEVVRMQATDVWTTIYTVPEYQVPASGPTPQRTIGAAAIMNGLLVTNTALSTVAVSIRILNTSGSPFSVLNAAPIPSNDFMIVALERQVMLTDEAIQVKMNTAQTASVHFSFILNTREEFVVIP